MPKIEISKRPVDGVWVVWAYLWTPDELLDNDPAANEAYLWCTYGWRASQWQPVFVGRDEAEARRAARNFI